MGWTPRKGARLGNWTLQGPLGAAHRNTWRALSDEGRLGQVLFPSTLSESCLTLQRRYHPALPSILASGELPVPYLVTELVSGTALSGLLRTQRAPDWAALNIAGVLADALAWLHGQGLCHGDLNPSRVIVGSARTGAVWLCESGLGGGGTNLVYAAPEQIAGARPGAATDVYALGLMIWELCHGALPWAEGGISGMLTRRRSEVPVPTQGTPALQRLISRLLAVDPDQRASSAEAVEALAAVGAVLPRPAPELVRERALRYAPADLAAEPAATRWLDSGGSLAVAGPSGSGRSAWLRRLIGRLEAADIPWMRWEPGGEAWGAVDEALRDRSIPGPPRPLPEHPDPAERAELAAAEIEQRARAGWVKGALALVADDLERLDAGSRQTLAALARRGRVHVAVTCQQAPEWARLRVQLGPLAPEGVPHLIEGILGLEQAPAELVAAVSETGRRLPARSVDALERALDLGLLRWDRGWRCDRDRLEAGALDQQPPRASLLDGVPLAIAGLLALHELPLAPSQIQELLGPELARLPAPLPDRPGPVASALDGLVRRGVVDVAGGLAAVRDPQRRAALVARSPNAAELHERLLHLLLEQQPVPWIRVGWHAAGSGSPTLVRSHGVPAARAALARAPQVALALIPVLQTVAPSPELGALHIDALVAQGTLDDAAALGRALIHQTPAEQRLPLLLSLAELLAEHGPAEDAAVLLGEARNNLADGVLPPARLVLLETQLALRSGDFALAVRSASTLAGQLPPAEPEPQRLWLLVRGLWAEALERLGQVETALAIIEAIPPDVGVGTPARARRIAQRGRLLGRLGRMAESAAALTTAAAEHAGLATRARARLLNEAAVARFESGDLSGALVAWQEASALSDGDGGAIEELMIRLHLCAGFREAGRWELARQAGEWALERARVLRAHKLRAHAALALAELALAQRHLEQAGQWLDRAHQVAARYTLGEEAAAAAALQGELALMRGEADAEDIIGVAITLARGAGRYTVEARARSLLAVARAGTGQTDAVDQLLATARRLVSQGSARELGEVSLREAEAALLMDQPERAEAALRTVSDIADEGGLVRLAGRARALRDQLDAVSGVPPSARRLRRLLELSVMVARRREPEVLLPTVARAALDLSGADRVFVLLNEDGGELRVAASAARAGVELSAPRRALVIEALRERRELVVREFPATPQGPLLAICAPLIDEDDPLGAIYLESSTPPEDPRAMDDLLRTLAANASVAVRNARLLQQAARRSGQAAEVAHDLADPLSAMVATARRRLHEGAEGRDADAFRVIAEQGQRLVGMVRSYLDQRHDARQQTDVEVLCSRLLALLEEDARARQVQFEFTSAGPAPVMGNATQLSRALSNILGNAIKYSPAGGRVEVGLRCEGSLVIWSVRDQGPGIPNASLSAIFDRGSQAPGALAGYGLGLSIAQRVVRNHGGLLSAGNHPDGGAIFRIQLPRTG